MLVALTHDEIKLAFGVDDLIQLNNIGMLMFGFGQSRQDSNLETQLVKSFIVELRFVNHFNSDEFAC